MCKLEFSITFRYVKSLHITCNEDAALFNYIAYYRSCVAGENLKSADASKCILFYCELMYKMIDIPVSVS